VPHTAKKALHVPTNTKQEAAIRERKLALAVSN